MKKIESDSLVTAQIAGDSIKITTALGTLNPVMKRYDKDHMLNTKTGEVVEIKHADKRTDLQNRRSLMKTFEKIRMLINANFLGGKNQLFVTLTYKESPMNDSARLYSDFKAFMKRLRKKVGTYIAYLVVIEPTAKGGWHAHCLMKRLDGKTFYLKNAEMACLWSQGFVNVRRVKQSDNLARYLSAYLGDIDLNNLDDEVKDKDAPKNIIKGGRLSFYPTGMRIYRTSRQGIKKPLKIKNVKEKIEKKYGLNNVSPTFYKSFDIVDSNLNFRTIEVEYYSRKNAELKRAMAKIERKA